MNSLCPRCNHYVTDPHDCKGQHHPDCNWWTWDHTYSWHKTDCNCDDVGAATTKPDVSICPSCGGPADNGHDRCCPPNPYTCKTCTLQDQERTALAYDAFMAGYEWAAKRQGISHDGWTTFISEYDK